LAYSLDPCIVHDGHPFAYYSTTNLLERAGISYSYNHNMLEFRRTQDSKRNPNERDESDEEAGLLAPNMLRANSSLIRESHTLLNSFPHFSF
jgi:hypothetical protein